MADKINSPPTKRRKIVKNDNNKSSDEDDELSDDLDEESDENASDEDSSSDETDSDSDNNSSDDEEYIQLKIDTLVVGIRYSLGQVKVGPVTLKRNPNNQSDKNAIEVHNEDGERVGHTRKELAIPLAKIMDGSSLNILAIIPIVNEDPYKNPLTIRISGICKSKEYDSMKSDLQKHRYYSMFYRPTVPMIIRNGKFVAYDLNVINTPFPKLTVNCHLALLGLLLEDRYQIATTRDEWIGNFNRLGVNTLEELSKDEWLEIVHRDELKTVIRYHNDCVKFIGKKRRDEFVSSVREIGYPQYFLSNASINAVKEYCRSSQYIKKEKEACFILSDDQNEELIERLQLKIIAHPTMEDETLHKRVIEKLKVPEEILHWDRKKLKEFIRNLKKGQLKVYHSRGLILGCEGAGKTTLLKKLKGLKFAEILNTKSTRGLEIHRNVFTIKQNKLIVNEGNISTSCFDAAKLMSSTKHQKKKDSRAKTAKEKGYSIVYPRNKSENLPVAEIDTAQPSTSRQSFTEMHSITKRKTAIRSQSPVSQHLPGKSLHEYKNADATNVLEVLRDKRQKRKVPLQTIDILDFAGQVGYYATHHVFLSKRGFFILVVDMSKDLDEIAGDGNKSDRMYRNWKNRKFIEFWLKSIHSYSGPEAPVLLVLSHAEGKSDEEIEEFFHQITSGLDKNLRKHLCCEREFSVRLKSKKNIPEIKQCIFDTVKNMDHWGEKLPANWALFENLIVEKRQHIKIIEFEKLWDLHISEFPIRLHFNKKKDMKEMLEFFHDIGLVMFFGQTGLRKTIILDVEHLIDAFKCIITTPNHAAKIITRKYVDEWDLFLKTGELGNVLLTALWGRENQNFLKDRSVLLSYMEQLGMLTYIYVDTQLGKRYQSSLLVPCMNKKIFPRGDFSGYLRSSILCFEFEFLPNTIFYRLISKCNSQEWKILTEQKEKCIYQTVAVFNHNNHIILVGMCRNAIELQVLVLKDSKHKIDKHFSATVGNTVQATLNEIRETCHTNLKFEKGYICRADKFCVEESHNFIAQTDLDSHRKSMPCPNCELLSEKHTVDVEEIESFWVQREGEDERSQIDLIFDFVSGKIISEVTNIAVELECEKELDILRAKYHSHPKEQTYQLLLQWKRRTTDIDHIYKLKNVLKEIKRIDVVNDIKSFDRETYHCKNIPNSHRQVTNKEISLLAKYVINEFSSCLRFIGMDEEDMERIKQDHSNKVKHQITTCFEEIQEKGTLSRQTVCNGLMYVKRNDVIMKLMKGWQ